MAHPVIASSVAGHSTAIAHSHDAAKPSGLAVGDLLTLTVSSDGSLGGTSMLGWALKANTTASNAAIVEVWAKSATSGDVSASVINIPYASLGVEGHMAWSIRRVTGWTGDLDDVEATAASSNTDTPDAPSNTPSFGGGDHLWIESVHWSGDKSHSSYPANYSLAQHTSRFADADGQGVASSARQLNATTEDPGEHTLSDNASWAATTICVRPPELSEGSGSCNGVGIIIGAGRCTRRGSGSCAGNGDPDGSGRCTRSGSGTCSGVGLPTGAGRCTRSGAGTISCVGTVVGTGRCQRSGSGTIACVGSITGAASLPRAGSGAVQCVGQIVGASSLPRRGGGAVVGIGSLFGSGCACSGSGSVIGIGSIIGSGTIPRKGSGSIAGVGVIVGSSSQPRAGSGTVIAVGSLVGAGCACSGSGVVRGVASLVGAGRCARRGSASVVGVGVVVGAGASDLPTGSGVIAGVAVIVGAGRALRSGTGTLAAVGSLVGVGRSVRAGSGAVASIGVIIGAASSDHPEGSGPVGGVSIIVGVGRTTKSGSGSVAGASVIVGVGRCSRSGSGSVLGIGLIVGAGAVEQPDGSGSVVGVGVIVGAGRNAKSGSGAIVGIGSVVGAATLSRCTLGTVDISVNPSLVTVTNPAGFTVGRAVRFKNAKEIGVDLLATIAAVSGNQITLAGSAGVSVTDEICFISTSRKWFGPGGEDCGCGCGECHCEDAARFFDDANIAISGMAGAGSPLDAVDIAIWNCSSQFWQQPIQPMQTWTFPGFGDESLAIDSHDDCYWGIESVVEIGTTTWYQGLGVSGWGGQLVPCGPRFYPSCGVRTALAAGRRLDGFPSYPLHKAVVYGDVYYRCVDGQKQRVVGIVASYPIHDELAFTDIDNFATQYPDWTWTDFGTRAFFESDGIDYRFELRQMLYAGVGGHPWRTYDLILSATSTTETVLDLSDAPDIFDPFGLLRGVVTVT